MQLELPLESVGYTPQEKVAQVAKIKLENAAKEFFNIVKHDDVAHTHSSMIVNVAESFVQNNKRSEKVARAMLYDPILYDEIEAFILKYIGLEKNIPQFKVFWNQLRDNLGKLHYREPDNFLKIIEGIKEKTFRFYSLRGINRGNIFIELQKYFDTYGEYTTQFLHSVYELNTQIGKNPTGKGEFIIDIFVNNAFKSSDVNIDGNEFEVKSSCAAVGETLGSKSVYISCIKDIYDDVNVKFDYELFSFGKKDFRKKWAPHFIDFANSHKNAAKMLLIYQYEFFLREKVTRDFMCYIDTFIVNQNLDKLCELYDRLCQQYILKSLNGKSMILFQEIGTGEKRKPSGEYVIFDADNIDLAVSFAGSERKTPAKVTLPKSSATMRPEILYNFLEEEEFVKLKYEKVTRKIPKRNRKCYNKNRNKNRRRGKRTIAERRKSYRIVKKI
jgi:hypothetical protein